MHVRYNEPMPSSDAKEETKRASSGPGSAKKAKPVRGDQVAMEALKQRVEALEKCVGELEKRLDVFLTAAPPEFRKLSPETVEAVIAEDPFAQFEVLRPYRFASLYLTPGQRIRVDRYERIMDHVRNGLLLGRLANHEAVLEQYRAEREAKEALAEAARQEARALAAKAAMEELGSAQESSKQEKSE